MYSTIDVCRQCGELFNNVQTVDKISKELCSISKELCSKCLSRKDSYYVESRERIATT